MKKILGSVFAILLLFCCGLFYGCGGDKYSGLSFSAGLSYDRNGSNVQVLSNGDYRVTTSEGVFDDHLDGSYTFYITENSTATATLQATYKGVSDDFNKGVSVSVSNEIVSIPTETTYSGDTVKKSITAYEKGTTLLTVYSNETGKTSRITVNVVKVATSIGFKNDNLALASVRGNKLILEDSLIETYPERSDITNVSYQVGKLDDGGNFVEYTQEAIVAEGISYDKYTSTLTVLNENFNDDFDSFYIKATYDNPLAKEGEVNAELTDITKVKIVKPITDLNFYYGKSSSEVTEQNKLNANDIQNLIINIEDLNYVDLIIVANSNKEKVSFGYVNNSSLPVSFKNNKDNYEYFKTNANGDIIDTADNYYDATKTFYYVKVIAAKKTTDNDAYPSGIYDLKFTCDYSDYVVEGYPLEKVLKIKNDTLIKNFSVNGETLENESIINSPLMTGFYDKEVYINNDAESLGTSLRISVGNPVVILNQNARFTLALYKNGQEITNVNEHFKVQKSVGTSKEISNVTDNFTSAFEKDTTFYIKPNSETGYVKLGDIYYLIVKAVMPEEYPEKQAVASIKLRVVQGISSFDGFDFIYNQYKVGDDGLYEVDEETEEKIVITTSKQGIKFDDSLISEQTLNLDLESGFPADITLSYLPKEADLNNIIITSSNEKVIRVVRNTDSDKLNQFKIYPVNIGSDDYIEISTTNLDSVYRIKVNVYRPITNFTVNLSSTNVSSGVGRFELDAEEKNIKSAEVQVNKTISLTFATLPATASKYSLDYYVYVSSIEEEKLLGNYSINYKGESSSNIAMIGNEHFQLDCKRNSFVFIKDESVGTTYYVLIKLTNLDGSYWSRTIELTSYVPVESIDTDLTRASLYNPNFIAYSYKKQDASDPSAFALKIEPNKNSGRIPTYNFEDFGRIVVKVNGITENTFSIRNGNLICTNENSVILLVKETKDDYGYYWFKLNPDYDYTKITSAIYLSIEIKEINSYFAKPISLRIFKAEQVSSLMTDGEEQQYFKQGLSDDKTIKINVIKETSYNKNLLVKVYDIFNVNGKEYYYENIEENSTLKDVNLTQGKNSTEFLLNISPFNAGKSVIVVMPEDRVIYLEQYSSWYEKQYIPVDILSTEFIENTFYYQVSTEYVLATEFEDGVQYYILATKLDENVSLWNGYLTFYVTVADGIKIPYQIATESELKEIDDSAESLSKRYILTKDIILSSSNWQPLASEYYLVSSVTEENFKDGVYYILNEDNYILQETYTADTEYYSYGFNGELSGKYSYTNVKGIEVNYFYKISNFTFVGRMGEINNGYGLFSQTGKQAKISNLKLNYTFFQPVITSSFTFGALTGTHYGYAENIEVEFNNFTLSSSNNLTIGGVVGNNKGFVVNNNTSSTGITGVLNIGLSNESLTANIGGIAGLNENTIIGSYDVEKDIVYTFNNAGFDSSLNIIVENNTVVNSKTFENTFIGGAVGRNTGLVKGVSVQGNITATNCHNVGGLIGFAGYQATFNGVKINDDGSTSTLYSVKNSYSIARVKGYEYVGGAIGQINGSSEVYIYNVSSENYVQTGNNRIFVQGYNYVGGFAGAIINANISYSYAVSYYDCSKFKKEQQFLDANNYDVVAIFSFEGASGEYVGGFAGVSSNAYISNSSSYLNIKGTSRAGVFISEANSTDGKNIFAISTLYAGSEDLVVGNIGFVPSDSNNYWYTIVFTNSNDLYYSKNQSADASTIMGVTLPDGWDKDDNINGGLPYLTIAYKEGAEPQVLFATTPITILANIKDNKADEGYTSYIKNDDSSLILFFNYDYLSLYPVEDIQKLNLILLESFSDLAVYAKTHKTARLNISTSSPNVIAINSDGTLRIVGEGKVVITISSKLNNEYKAQIYVIVKFGINDINLYSNVALTDNLKENNSKIEILKSRNQTLYLESDYVRLLPLEGIDAELKSMDDVAMRFIVKGDNNLKNILDAADGELDDRVIYTVDDLFKFNGLTWLYDGTDYSVDIPANTNPIITPIKAMDSLYNNLTIYYVPIITQTFNVLPQTIVLNSFEGNFDLSIIKGATNIIIEKNMDIPEEGFVQVSQLETFSFTVTLFTDYEQDEIVDNFDRENLDGKLTIVKSDISRIYEDSQKTILKSISVTYTINYKDKMTAVEEDIEYNFEFIAASNPSIKIMLPYEILGQDKINQVYGTIYANLTDFPQQPEKTNTIFNGNVGVLSVEVYPFFSNYNKMRVYYDTSSTYPLLMTQLSYNISGELGELLTDYPASGSITDNNDIMNVEKSSGQDTYLLNDLGIYSYSKIYFFSLLVSTEVPDNTQYNVYVQFLNRDNTIIETFTYSFKTIAQPSINLSFDSDLKSVDNVYYLPLNTNNNLYVNLVNYDGEISWEITSNEVTLGDNDIEVLTPTLNEDGTYNFRLLRYGDALVNDNVFSVNLIGKTITLKGSIVDNDRVYSDSIDILVTMFTVRDINVQNSDKGYMTLPMSTTTPLQVVLDVFYDESLMNSEDNWYAEWYSVYEEKQDTTDMLYKYLTACGYEISKNFSSYLTQLTNAISKANYDYSSVSATKTSGVWFFNSDNESGYIQTNKDYNASTFGVELYNEFFAVHGYQIDKDSNLELRVKLSYTNNEGETVKNIYANGIPNVYNYNISPTNTTYKTDFEIHKPFVLNFVYQSSLIEAIPVSTAEEFINMEAGFDYRLINDIVLEHYTPISTAINSFDGNNYNIYITSFSYDSSTEDDCVLGLFDTIDKNTLLYNVKVYYANKVTLVNDNLVPGTAALNISLLNSGSVKFGGIAVTNNGVLTNCRVLGKFNLTLNVDKNSGTIADTLNGGLVATNSNTGYITNCKVENFDLSCYGVTGGFVGQNSGRIVASYFNESSLNNLSSDDTAGFVYNNNGEIYECFAQGKRKETDNDIRNTGAGVGSKGVVGGFVHTNTNLISDCYSNISLSSSKYISGFVYTETSTSIISRCYSISYKSSSDNSTVASPFAGANSANYTVITINGQLNNCYFLNIDGTWNSLDWESDEENKKAIGLTLDEFSTHTNFTNYDLSLTYKTGIYADNKTQYNYIDGYTWVIIEGKPVIVSTLVDTISQSDYIGKFKNYNNSYTYYNADDFYITEVEVAVGTSKIRKSYYSNPDKLESTALTDKQLLFYTIQDNIKQTLTYSFTSLVNEYDITPITITYSITLENGLITGKKLISAEHTDSEGKIVVLDVKDSVGLGYEEDKNFRANDTIEITYNEKGIINNIIFKELESASYHYGSNAFEISHVVGSRTNPQMIYDYNSFVVTTSTDNIGKYYRVVRDINFNYQFTPTAYIDFQGSLQGNYMNFDNLSISYLNNSSNEKTNVTNSFGLFSKISTVKAITSGSGTNNVNRVIEDDFSTTVSNLKLNVVEVLSNSHRFVGALAGQLGSYEKEINNRKIIINNVSIGGVNGNSAYIQGKNAVGGLAGLAVGSIIIKDINCSVNVNATKEINNTDVGKILYVHSLSGQESNGALGSDSGNTSAYSVANLAYAGGVIGIFYAEKISDESTQKDYNANNITVGGEISIIGGIVGSAFGLVGNTTVVNFVNSTVQSSEKSYLKASGYAGGLVGENRGVISSSSITYGTAETYSAVKVGSSNLIKNNYFYNEKAASSTLAIGGLVGLNNGGQILNSISTIDVRNKTAVVAGGAVGRMVEGKVEYVISSGSVVGENVVGGLIGTINNADILTHSEGTNNYDEAAISSTGTSGSGGETSTPTVISNSVAATNWQITDYTYYKNMKASKGLVAGFVGLIAYSGSDYNFISFENTGVNSGYNYYSNTVYTSLNSSSAQMYLKPAYKSNTLDKIVSTELTETTIEVLTYTDNAGNSEQAVFPYSTREMYYEDTLTTAKYQIRTERNALFSTDSVTQFIYSLESSSSDIENINDLYVQVKLTDFNNLNIPTQGGSTITGTALLEWYNKIFGRVYIFDSAKQLYVEATKDDLSQKLYYIPKPDMDNYIVSKKYQVDGINDIVMTIEKGNLSGSKYDECTLSNIDDFKNIQRFVVNGIEIPNLSSANVTYVNDTENNSRIYTNNNVQVILPNGVRIIGIKYCVKEVSLPSMEGNTEVYKRYYRLQYIELKNKYDVSESYIESNITRVSTSQQSYTLSVDSKAVIYENFMDSGYWKVDKNFLLNANYEGTTKYLSNLEYASIYLWNTFIDTSKDINTGKLIYNLSVSGNTVEIFDAVDLATFAHAVNNPDFYNEYKSKNVVLKNDIDLSGKYWVPIANSENRPFLGTFSGLGTDALGNEKIFTIKYATVNQNCNLVDPNKDVDIAALFGYLGNGAVISDLIITGGDMSGKVAAGLVGFSIGNVTINNVTNRNNITGSTSAGGIVGYAKTGMLTIEDSNNYGEISHHNSENYIDGIGGIVGFAEKLTINNCQNNGVIYVFNNKTSYTNIEDPIKTELCVGGIVGKVINCSFVGANSNKGNITINSNAHTLKVGGVVGSSINNSKVVSGLKNYADLTINSNNIYSALENNSEYAFLMIGGVVGDLQNNLTLCGNEGKINFSLNTTSNSYIGIGGIAGFAIADINTGTNKTKGITESYNTNNIEVSTINVKAKVSIGGILGYAKINDLDRNVTSIINVRDCYNSGDLQSDSNGTIFAGGIVGSALYEDMIEGIKTYLLSMRNYTHEEKLYVANCINLGYVNITNINEFANSLGAIVGLGEMNDANITTFVVLNGGSNFYLRDSAYSGATIYPGYSIIIMGDTSSDANSYKPVDTTQERGCRAQLITSLKDVSTYDATWNFALDATGVWIQSYDTWYPSIKKNMSSSIWADKQEEVAQEKGSFVVSTAEQLAYLSAKINSGEIETTNITIKLTDYIDLSNRYWTPIGTEENPFKGTFDGNGFVIRNITIDGEILTDVKYAGLFGFIQDATIKNLGLESVIIKNVDYAASLTYSAKNSVITKVYSDNGGSDDSIISASSSAGGLICYADDCIPLDENNSEGGLYYSYNNIPVEINGPYAEGKSYVGGLIARMRNTLIDSCYNNTRGSITTSQKIEEESIGNNNPIVITDYADKYCGLFNVFNLASNVKSNFVENIDGVDTVVSTKQFECSPMIYELEIQDGKEEASIVAGSTPEFANLKEKEDGTSLKDIWTEEYTLNEDVGEIQYPSIRGLGQEWKNTESEALMGFTSEDLSTDSLETTLASINITNTLVDFTGENQTDYKIKTYYLITSAEELAWVSTNVNSGNLSTSTCEFILVKDIDLSKRYWTPIGSNSVYPFQGIFNFNGHVIKGLTIDSNSLTYGGLFGYTNGAKIINGYLVDSFVKVKYEDPKTNIYVGSLVGKGYNTTIENIYVSTAVGAFSNSGAFVGGLIGSLTGTQDYKINNIRIEKSVKNKGTPNQIDSYIDISNYYYQVVEDLNTETGEESGRIKSKTTNIGAFSDGGNVYAGGVVGYISGYEIEEVDNEYLLNASYSDCNLTAVSVSNAASVYAGGVVGYALEQVSFNNIQSSGMIKTYTNQTDILGGIIGYMSNGNIKNSCFNGYLEYCLDFNNHYFTYVGGIVGYMETEGWLKQCVNKGELCKYYANNNNDPVVCGGIIGFSNDRYFTNDENCIYSTGYGFTGDAVGLDELKPQPPTNSNNEEAYNTYLEKINAYNAQLSAIFSTDLNNINSNYKFDEIYWVSQSLKSKLTFITGCGTTYKVESIDGLDCSGLTLQSNGKLAVNIDTTNLSASTSLGSEDSICVSIVDEDFNYVYFKYTPTDGDGFNKDNFFLNDLLAKASNVNKENLVYLCITIVDNQ